MGPCSGRSRQGRPHSANEVDRPQRRRNRQGTRPTCRSRSEAICRALTSAAARGASIFKMADQSRHKSMDTLRGYIRDAEIFKRHAGEGLL